MQISDVLAKSIRNEYLWIVIVFAAWFAIQFLIMLLIDALDKKKKDVFVLAFLYAYARFCITCLIAFLLCCVNPVRILITRWSEVTSVKPAPFCALIFVVVILPIPVSVVCVLFGRKIENYLYHRKYYTGKGAYTVAETDYKSPAEFRDELLSRGLFYNEDTRGFVQSPGEGILKFATLYYPESVIMPLTKAAFDDNLRKNKVLSPDSEENYPAYVYNALLLLTDNETRLRYVPLARYYDYPYGKMSFVPDREDYFIECKILFVDSHVYAIIGVNKSMDVKDSFDQFQEPYYMLLSETKEITTYYEGKYYPNGAIYNECGAFEMLPNTREQSFGYPGKPVNYPVRVVERVNLSTINRIAAELQDGILKQSIESHRKKRAERKKAEEKKRAEQQKDE